MLKRIYVDNYKCLLNFELRLRELTLLVGRNGAGKTAVFDVVYALRRLLEGRSRVTDRDVFPPSSLTRWQERETQSYEVNVELEGVQLAYRLEVEHDKIDRRARIKREVLEGNGGLLFKFELGEVRLYRDDHSEGPAFTSDWTESALARVGPDKHNTHLRRFLDFMRNVLVCGLNPSNFAAEAVGEDQILARDGSNFVDWYRHLLQERQDLAYGYTQVMRDVLDGLRGFQLEKVGIDTRALVGVFGERDKKAQAYRFHELSDGQRVLIVLYALMLLTTDSGQMLLIDEPVNFVGLSEIQPWLIALSDACGSSIPQAVLASHHPEVLDYIGADRVILLSRDGTGPTRVESLSENVEHLARNGPLRLSEVIARGWER